MAMKEDSIGLPLCANNERPRFHISHPFPPEYGSWERVVLAFEEMARWEIAAIRRRMAEEREGRLAVPEALPWSFSRTDDGEEP